MVRKRVVCVCSFMCRAGAQEAMLRLAGLLRARGHEAEVWFLYEASPAYRGEPHVRVLHPVARPGAGGYGRIALALLRELRAARPDAVVSFLPLANLLAQASAWLLGIRCRVASQRVDAASYGRAQWLLDMAVGSTGIYQANVAVSEAVRQSFARHPGPYRRRLAVVPNGIAWAPSALDKAAARARFGLWPEAALAVAVGRAHPQKNYPFLLDALAAAPGVALAIAGDGPRRPALEAQAAALGLSGRVRFLGELDRREVPHLLRAADLFVQPSLYEGQSNALLEAINEGLPVLASDIPPQAEVLRLPGGGAAGLLLPLDDSQAWAGALCRCAGDAGLRATLAAAARARAAAFTTERMADGFERLITGPAVAAGGMA